MFNDTKEKAVEKAIDALADMIPLEAIQPPHSPALTFPKWIKFSSVRYSRDISLCRRLSLSRHALIAS